jgi:sugar lactone lactonase YvrE
VAAQDLDRPNGMAMHPDGRTLILAETAAWRLIAFDVSDDGSLSGRRVFAELGREVRPDGICLDAEGAAWVACPNVKEVRRILPGGQVTRIIATPGRKPLACVLGGGNRRSLFITTARGTTEELRTGKTVGRVERIDVDVPGSETP